LTYIRKISGKRQVRALSRSLNDKPEQETRINVAGSLLDMVSKRKKLSHLLQSLRKDYQLLTLEERNQLKCFILGFYPNDTRSCTSPDMLKSEVEH
jgi:hypothetical protein